MKKDIYYMNYKMQVHHLILKLNNEIECPKLHFSERISKKKLNLKEIIRGLLVVVTRFGLNQTEFGGH